MENGLTEEELLKVIAYQIAKNQCSYDSKSEEEKKELLSKVEMVADSQVTELSKKFNSILNSVGVEIVPKMKLELLVKINDRVKDEKISSFSSIFTSEEMINYISNEAIKEDQRLQGLKELDGDAPSLDEAIETFAVVSILTQNEMEDKKAAFCAGGNFSMPDGLNMHYIEPNDPRFSCSKEQAAEDMEILYHEKELEKLFKTYNGDPKDYDATMKNIEHILGLNNGRDAGLNFIESQLELDGISFITENPLGKGLFEKMSILLKSDRENGTGMKDDNYTIFCKMKLFSKIKEEYKKGNITDSYFQQLEEQMRDMDSELYDMLEKNQSLVERIQKDNFEKNDVNTNTSKNLAIKFVGKSESITREETLERLNEYAKNNPECQKEPTGEVLTPVGEEIIIEQPPEKTYVFLKSTEKSARDVLEHNKGKMLRCYSEQGIETVLRALSRNSTSEQLSLKTRSAWLESITELLDVEKIGTEESIIRTEEDWKAVKEHLKAICNDEKSQKYVQKLGTAVKTISDKERGKNILGVGSVEEIVKSFSDNTKKFDGNQETDKGEGR